MLLGYRWLVSSAQLQANRDHNSLTLPIQIKTKAKDQLSLSMLLHLIMNEISLTINISCIYILTVHICLMIATTVDSKSHTHSKKISTLFQFLKALARNI